MKFLVVLLLSATLAASADIEEEKGVLVLTEKNFDDAIKDNEHILVEFYAPWCGHCKSLEPEYESAAKQLSESGSSIKLAKVDATAEKALGDKFKIQGFPTLKFFKSGKPKEYNGPRKADGIVAWLEKKTGPPAKTLANVEEAEKLIEDKQVVVIGFFKEENTDEAKEFLAAAAENDEQTFCITSDKAVWKKYDVTEDKSIVLFKKFDEGRNEYTGKAKQAEINTWVMGESVPLINEFSQETAQQIFGSEIKIHFLMMVSKESEDFDKVLDAMKPTAKSVKGKMIFVYVDSAAEENLQVLEFFGIKPEDTPVYGIYEMENNAKYMTVKGAGVAEKDMAKFVEDYQAGKLKKTLKSENLPEDWDAKPVKVLVSSNFQEIAMDKNKDVFVEFYAPWCGHCKSLAPIWDKLAEKFADSDSVVVAKMDSTANEIEEVTIQGFPTLKMFKKETNEIVDYEGKRDLDSMVKFLETGEQDKDSPPTEPEIEDYDDEEGEEEEEEEEEGKGKDEL